MEKTTDLGLIKRWHMGECTMVALMALHFPIVINATRTGPQAVSRMFPMA